MIILYNFFFKTEENNLVSSDVTTEEPSTKSSKRHRKPRRRTTTIEDGIRVAKDVNRYNHDIPGINEGRNLIKIIYKNIFIFFKKLKDYIF